MNMVMKDGIDLMNDNVCRYCTERHMGCHNVETCEAWAEHERKKAEEYEWKQKQSYIRMVENTRINRCIRQAEHDRRK